jgi:phosphonate transport system substrate-binding protein
VEAWAKTGLTQLILMIAWLAVASSSQAQELKFGVVSVLSKAETQAAFEPLMTYLSTALGQTVSLYIAKDEGDLRTRMEAGVVDVAAFSPFAYVDAARGGKIRIIAQSVLNGSATYRGLIIKRFDSGINTLTDLTGRRFAFVDLKSTAGYVYPRAMLLEKGINPERTFKDTLFLGSDEKVIAAVLLGSAHAGAVYDGAVAAAKAKGLATFDLEVLASTDPIPYDAIVVRVDLDAVQVKRMQAALVELNRSPAGREVLVRGSKKLTGYVAGDDSLFEVVRRTAKVGGM